MRESRSIRRAGRRVLVVEDEYLIASMLADELEEAGYQVVGPFHDLETATSSAAEQSFDLALLDVNLNGTTVFPLPRSSFGEAFHSSC